MIYADTSVLLPCYAAEVQSVAANALLSNADVVAVSDLSSVEFHAMLARKVRLGQLSRESSIEISAVFNEHVMFGIYRRLPIERAHYEMAEHFATELGVPLGVEEVMHLAVAKSNNATLATFDFRLADAARAIGLDVIP